MSNDDDLEAARKLLNAHPDYRVLRRLRDPSTWSLGPAEGPKRRGLFVDVETTGLDVELDEVIEIALLPFEYDLRSGRVVSVLESKALNELRDPGVPIPPESMEIHGITDAMVDGKVVDEMRLEELVRAADLVISHNAAFDCPMVERRWKVFEEVPWACSLTDVDWRAEGFPSGKLEFLLLQMGWFYEGHRALVDCVAGIFALTQDLKVSGKPAMAALLESARLERTLVRATDAPFEAKEVLRKRGYRWDAGTPKRAKAWWTMTSSPEEEITWLRAEVYGYEARVPTAAIDARTRFSNRRWESFG
jgi:DNA polymerase-3 subunit epsilon